jgi:3-dehydroquinate dehydratase I
MICISLSSQSFDECVKAFGKSQFTELRIDLLELSWDQLKTLFSMKRETIATCRPGKYNDIQRIAILKMAIDAGAMYIDIEYESEVAYREELVKYAKSRGTLVIISYHDYVSTPSKPELIDIIVKSKAMQADRVKIATKANTFKDNSRILSLYEDCDCLIAFCMGKLGKITRVAAPKLGADFTFVAYSREGATAPGQFTLEEMKDIYKCFD